MPSTLHKWINEPAFFFLFQFFFFSVFFFPSVRYKEDYRTKKRLRRLRNDGRFCILLILKSRRRTSSLAGKNVRKHEPTERLNCIRRQPIVTGCLYETRAEFSFSSFRQIFGISIPGQTNSGSTQSLRLEGNNNTTSTGK